MSCHYHSHLCSSVLPASAPILPIRVPYSLFSPSYITCPLPDSQSQSTAHNSQLATSLAIFRLAVRVRNIPTLRYRNISYSTG